MPIKLKYIDEGIGVELLGSGLVTGRDIIEANKSMYSHRNFSQQKYQLIDRTACTEFEVTNDEIKVIAEQDIAAAIINPNIHVALISTTDHQFGMSRMYQAYVGDHGLQTEVFRDRDSALKWIGSILKKYSDPN